MSLDAEYLLRPNPYFPPVGIITLLDDRSPSSTQILNRLYSIYCICTAFHLPPRKCKRRQPIELTAFYLVAGAGFGQEPTIRRAI